MGLARHGRRACAWLVGRAGAVVVGSGPRLRHPGARARGAGLRTRSGRGSPGGTARDRRPGSLDRDGGHRRSHVRAGDGDRSGSPCGRSSWSSPAAITTAYPTASGDVVAAVAPASRPSAAAAFAAPASTGTAFGVDRRTPRGAFLWPSATVAALGLNAAGPDGQQSMSVAALELLAAQAVAEIGTYAAMSDRRDDRDDAPTALVGSGSASVVGSTASATRGAIAIGASGAGPMAGLEPREPGETDVLEAAASLVPATRRARFDALYVALSQTPSGRTWSPAARAARALALAGRGDDAPLSARDRAATAWDVLPVVYATEGMSNSEADSYLTTSSGGGSGAPRTAPRGGGARRGGAGGNEYVSADTRAGLGGLSARAGEALSSYVTPSVTCRFVLAAVLAAARDARDARVGLRTGDGPHRPPVGPLRRWRGRDSILVRGGRAQDARRSQRWRRRWHLDGRAHPRVRRAGEPHRRVADQRAERCAAIVRARRQASRRLRRSISRNSPTRSTGRSSC